MSLIHFAVEGVYYTQCIKGTCKYKSHVSPIAQPYHQLLRALKGTNHEIYLKIYEVDAAHFFFPWQNDSPTQIEPEGSLHKENKTGATLRPSLLPVTSLFH